jgi:nucleoside-diphosphate-sugar epimerase
MRILVTGSTGFIGKHILLHLLKDNDEVIATYLPSEKKEIVKVLNIKWIEYNIDDCLSEERNLFEYFQKPDLLIHLAWQGLPNYNKSFHFNKNLFIHQKFVHNLVSNGLKDISITGTCLEYGMKNGCLSEEMDTNPQNFYALAKDALRCYVELLKKDYEFNFKWIRLFYMYGEGQNSKSLIPQLYKAIKTQEKVFNMSGGDQLRDYLKVEVVANYILKTAMQNSCNGIINCCSGVPVSVRNLVEKIIRENKATIDLNLGYYPYPEYEPLAFWGDNSKLKQILKLK